MKIYGTPVSTCTRKVMLTCNEKNFPFTIENVNLSKGEHKRREHLQRHPFGVIPVLEDNDFHLYESNAIIHYLDKKSIENGLTPTNPEAIGRMEQWISVQQSYFGHPVIQLVKQLYWGPMEDKVVDQIIVNEAKEKVAHALDVIDKELKMRPYLAGNDFTLADISWMPYLEYLFPASMGSLIIERPHVNAWWEKISKRPTWQKVLAWK